MQGLIPAKRSPAGALIGVGAAIGLTLAAYSAQAAPCVNTTPISPPAQSQAAVPGCGLAAAATSVQVVFAFQSADDEDTLTLSSNVLFDNHTSALGDSKTVTGLTVGEALPFMFADLIDGDSDTIAELSTDGQPHTAYAAATTGSGPIDSTSAGLFFDDSVPRKPAVLSAAVVSAMNAIDDNSSDWLFIGFEDRFANQQGDFDYNDLVFAFHNVKAPPTPTPEPASLALLGLGLTALGLVRRRRASKT